MLRESDGSSSSADVWCDVDVGHDGQGSITDEEEEIQNLMKKVVLTRISQSIVRYQKYKVRKV